MVKLINEETVEDCIKPSMHKVVDVIKNKSIAIMSMQELVDQKANELKEKDAIIHALLESNKKL